MVNLHHLTSLLSSPVETASSASRHKASACQDIDRWVALVCATINTMAGNTSHHISIFQGFSPVLGPNDCW